MGLLPGEEAEFLESLDGFRPRLEAVESGEAISRKVIESPVGIHDVDDGEVVPEADLVVGLVMGGGHLEDARAEFEIDRLVADDRQLHLDIEGKGTPDMLADQVGVALILGIHGDGRVTHDRLGTRGGDLKPGAGCFHDLELEVVEVALLLLGDDLLVAQGGEGDGAPVHHPLAAVDQALSVEIHKDLLHFAGIGLVHGEALARPVAGGAEFLQLPDDDAAVLFLPLPDLLEEGFAAEVVAGLFLLLAELALDDGLGGDAGVVGAGKPENLVSRLAGAAGEDVLQGVVEDMSEGQDPGDIRRGDDDREGRGRGGGIGGEAT